jgi:hypothetical protein
MGRRPRAAHHAGQRSSRAAERTSCRLRERETSRGNGRASGGGDWPRSSKVVVRVCVRCRRLGPLRLAAVAGYGAGRAEPVEVVRHCALTFTNDLRQAGDSSPYLLVHQSGISYTVHL